MTRESALKDQLKKHLSGGEAFMPVDEMLKKIPLEHLAIRPQGLPYSFYELFYHMWFTQRDILQYGLDPKYTAPSWPQDYWPRERSPGSEEDWTRLKNEFFEDREKLKALILAEENDLTDPVPSNKKHTIFREILLVIEHTSYHSGQLLIILRHLGLHSS